MDYVIIGNSAAAVAAIEAIRKVDKRTRITVVSDEPYPAYSRPLISYYLAGSVDEKKMRFRARDFYEKNKVKTVLGRKAVAIKPSRKVVVLEGGRELKYGKLLIATGGKPFIPPIKGLEGEGVFTFTRLDDAKEVARYARKAERAVVIGGGLIGLKSAEGLIELGLKVTVVELAPRILSTILDEKGSRMFEAHLKMRGAKIVTGDTVAEIVRQDAAVDGVVLKSGKEIPCDMVIVAIGVVPNTDITQGTKIKVDRGIVVDEHMETSVKGIYAAGDVVETYDVLAKTSRPAPIWPNAYEQGQVAGFQMAGEARTYPGSFGMNSLEVLGLPTITVGLFGATGNGFKVLSKTDPAGARYRKIVLKAGYVVGGIFVGDIDRAGIITGLIKDRVKVQAFEKYLLSDDFGYALFPEPLRKEKLE